MATKLTLRDLLTMQPSKDLLKSLNTAQVRQFSQLLSEKSTEVVSESRLIKSRVMDWTPLVVERMEEIKLEFEELKKSKEKKERVSFIEKLNKSKNIFQEKEEDEDDEEDEEKEDGEENEDDEEDEDEEDGTLEKGKKAMIGETRTWGKRQMRREANGWVEVRSDGRSKKEASEERKAENSVSKQTKVKVEGLKSSLEGKAFPWDVDQFLKDFKESNPKEWASGDFNASDYHDWADENEEREEPGTKRTWNGKIYIKNEKGKGWTEEKSGDKPKKENSGTSSEPKNLQEAHKQLAKLTSSKEFKKYLEENDYDEDEREPEVWEEDMEDYGPDHITAKLTKVYKKILQFQEED